MTLAFFSNGQRAVEILEREFEKELTKEEREIFAELRQQNALAEPPFTGQSRQDMLKQRLQLETSSWRERHRELSTKCGEILNRLALEHREKMIALIKQDDYFLGSITGAEELVPDL